MSKNVDETAQPRGGGRRGICSKCGRLVALAPKTGLIRQHSSRWGNQCPGRHQPPADAQSTADAMAELLAISTNLREHSAQLQEHSANLQEFIERRAQEIAAARLTEHHDESDTEVPPGSDERRVGRWVRRWSR